MKIKCSKCQKRKDQSSFAKNKGRAGSHAAYCSKCQSEYHKAYYRKNKARHNERRYQNQILRREAKRAFVDKLKSGPCVDCITSYIPVVMEFDHVRGYKLFNLGDAVRMDVSLEKIQAEAAKCDLVCANCHRIRTFKRSRMALSAWADTSLENWHGTSKAWGFDSSAIRHSKG